MAAPGGQNRGEESEAGSLWRELFGVDLRALALLRIGLSLLVLIDLARRAPLRHTLLGETGVLRREHVDGWGAYLWFPSETGIDALFCLAAVAALFLCVGAWTRVASVATWVLFHSLADRNPWVLDGGDDVLRLLLLWGMFLPWGEHFSLDARRLRRAKYTHILTFSGAGVRLQVAVVYLGSVLLKIRGSSWREGTAVADALSQSLWARPMGSWIAERAAWASATNYLVLLVELGGSILLFFPWKTNRARRFGIVLFLGLQLGIGLSLRMGLFPWVMTLALLPSVGARTAAPASWMPSPRYVDRWAGAVVLGLSLASFVHSSMPRRFAVPQFERLTASWGLTQYWGMYSPNPYDQDFALRVELLVDDGRAIVLDAGQGRARWGPLDQLWVDYRAAMYLENLSEPTWSEGHQDFAVWVRRRYDREHPRSFVRAVKLSLLEWDPDVPEDPSVQPLYAGPALP